MIHDIYLELDDEQHAPPAQLVRVNNNHASRIFSSDEAMDAVIHFAVGEYTESYAEAHFATTEERQFSVRSIDLVKALIALGILPTGTAMTPQTIDPDWEQV